jgi:release factor glutamine methyltransferase
VSLKEALRQAEAVIASHDIHDARVEAELLLMYCLGIGKVELYTRLNQPLSSFEADSFWSLVERRLQHEPTAYIVKQCQFYGTEFYVDPCVLIPRPESELLVEMALEFAKRGFAPGETCWLADVGTGSGAIAIAMALHLPQAKVYALDVSAAALEVAAINCARHGVEKRVHLLIGDMLQPLPLPVHVIVANLPYVTDADLPHLAPEIRDFEPVMALAGGADGLAAVRRLLPQAGEKLLPGGAILVEIGEGQGSAATELARRYFPTARVDLVPDLSGIDRVVRVQT